MSESRPVDEKSKSIVKRKISWSTPLEELIEAYLYEGDLRAAFCIAWPSFLQRSNKSQEDRQTKNKWLTQLLGEAKSWSEEPKEVKSLNDQIQLRKQTLLWELSADSHAEISKLNKWVLQSAEQGEPVAQFLVANSYLHLNNKYGFPIDGLQAIEFTKKSANQGYAPAQSILGFDYYNGIHIVQVKDSGMAEYWYGLAAAQGLPTAQINLGVVKEDQSNIKDASLWYRRAAMQWNSAAINYLDGLLWANSNNLHVLFNAAVAGLLGWVDLRRLNILLRQLVDRIEVEEQQEAKAMSPAMKEFYELFEIAEDVPQKIINKILTDEKVKARWGQYAVKHAYLQKRFECQANGPMTPLVNHIFSFVANMTPGARDRLQAAASASNKLPYARSKVTDNLPAVLEGKEEADKALYENYKVQLESFKPSSEPKTFFIKDYSGLEKQIAAEAKKTGTPNGKMIALGLLYYAAGDYSRAEKEFLKAKQYKDVRSYTYLAELYSIQRHYFKVPEELAEEILQEGDEVVKSRRLVG
jgi:TPR repeat protein